jgi:alginate O-acetyltransferase complex protein AlgI
MLFNSFSFIFLFFPFVFILLKALSFYSKELSIYMLILFSCVFYGSWNYEFLPILIISVLLNYFVKIIIQNQKSNSNHYNANIILFFGISGNLAALFYYKYSYFVISGLGLAFNSDFGAEKVILPLGISFFTFQQIGYLISAGRGTLLTHSFKEYALFVTFFPQLIAGPIVLQQEFFPQIRRRAFLSFRSIDIALGLTIFAIGLFKKTVIADSISDYTSPFYLSVASGGSIGQDNAWAVVLGYSVQLYFDFSGYSDMALGLARIFGISLPINFLSPFKAQSILEFWRRWHITLTRFIFVNIHSPLSLSFMRLNRRLANQNEIITLLIQGCLPLIISFFVIGIWHGANWTFVLFGCIHATFASINFMWRQVFSRLSRLRGFLGFLYGLICQALTVLAFTIGLVPFRAENLQSVKTIYFSLLGLGLEEAPVTGEITKNQLVANAAHIPIEYWWSIAALYLVLFLAPNIVEIMRPRQIAVNVEGKARIPIIGWKPSIVWAGVVALFLFCSMLGMSKRVAEFVYYAF